MIKNIIFQTKTTHLTQTNGRSLSHLSRKEQNRKLKTNLCPSQTHPLRLKVLQLRSYRQKHLRIRNQSTPRKVQTFQSNDTQPQP